MNMRISHRLMLAALVVAPVTTVLASETAAGSGEPVTVRAKAELEANRRTAMQSRICAPELGSRIRRAGPECQARGRSYSREEIERTGSIDIADALQRLDPSISRGR